MTVSEILQTSILYRGTILQEMALMEQFLNQYIAAYFCGKNDSRIGDMHVMVLGDERITLSNKVQIFNLITANYDVDWVKGYKSKRAGQDKKVYNLNQDLNYIIEQRNIFAHRVLDGGALAQTHPQRENSIRYVRLKNDIQTFDFTKEDFELIVEVIIAIRDHLAEKVLPTM